MRKKPERPLLVTVLILAVLPGALAAQKTKPPAERPNRLIRVDLLTPPPVESRPVRRDVFSPGSGVAQPPGGIGLPSTPMQPGLPGPSVDAGTAPTLPGQSGEPPVYIPAIRYIGYVDFGRKFTALVIADGQPLAVDEKEELLPGYRVAAISPEKLDIVDPGGTKRSYLREGELP